MTSFRADASALPPAGGIAVIVLLDDEGHARSFAHLLEDVRREPAPPAVLVPPVRGLRFFADSAVQPAMDSWWGAHVDRRALPLWVADHQDGLEEWIDSVDGLFVVCGDRLEGYAASPRVTCVPSAVPLDVLGAVIRELGGGAGAAPAAPAPQPAGRRSGRSRFRRAQLRAAEDLGTVPVTAGASSQLFEPTQRHPVPGVCDELIDVLGDAMHRIRALAGAAGASTL